MGTPVAGKGTERVVRACAETSSVSFVSARRAKAHRRAREPGCLEIGGTVPRREEPAGERLC